MKLTKPRTNFLILLASLWLTYSTPASAFSLGQFWDKLTGKEYSPSHVAKELTKGVRNEEEKARRLFLWITEHIAYDVQAYQTGVQVEQSLEDLMKSRKGTCEDYARLFHEMATAVGLRSQIVSGFVKDAGQLDGASAHAWNLVQIKGRDWVVDPTWGSGFYDHATGQYTARRDMRYFMTEPAQILLTHRQADESGRALELPGYSFEQFKQVQPNTRKLAKLGVPADQLIRRLGPPVEQQLPQAQEAKDMRIRVVLAPLERVAPGVLMRFEINHLPETRLILRTDGSEQFFNTDRPGRSWLEFTPRTSAPVQVLYRMADGGLYELLRY